MLTAVSRNAWTGFVLVVVWCLVNTPGRVQAYRQPTHRELPNFDRRQRVQARPPQLSPKRQAAQERLQRRVPRVRVQYDTLLGTPNSIASPESFLTGPAGQGKGVATVYGRGRGRGNADPYQPVKAFLAEHPDLIGCPPEQLDQARLLRQVMSPANGLRSVVWEQQLDGIPVYEGVLVGHLTRDGELVCLSSQFLPDLIAGAEAGTPNRAAVEDAPPVTAALAVVLAAANLEEMVPLNRVRPLAEPPDAAEAEQRFQAGDLPGPAAVRRVWLPLDAARLRLCWQVELTRHAGNERYRVLVDVQSGEIMLRRCLTVYLTDASYRVFTSDSPSPFSPSHPEPSTNQPPLVARELVTLAARNTNASPLGWIHDGANETLGNNVDAHLDRNADNAPDLPRPRGMPERVFDFPLDLNASPATYGDAAVVQLFYWCNWMHDQLYGLGFTEAAGNFQKDNLGRGGRGGDPLLADAQDGSGVNNANFTPTPDGRSPRIQMFVFDGPDPARDGSLDGEIVLHEYTHGLTDRLVGGGVGIGALQSAGMGEGWSDWYALALLSEAGDDPDGAYAVGGYATWQFFGLTENYYFGIRRYPYSTDRAINPLTFKDIDPLLADRHPEVPINPVFGFGDPAEVHNQGEVWCLVLWEMRANLVRKHGFTVGNRLALQLVTDGLKLSPPNPNFLQARDAILLADQVNTGGANFNELWAAFAKRGMGFSARAPSSSTTTGVQEAFDLPDALLIQSAAGSTFSGPVAGPFTPECKVFTLTNHSAAPLEWSVQTAAPWLTVSLTAGQLDPATATTVSVCLNAEAAPLPLGVHAATLEFANATSGFTQHREVRLRVLGFTGLPFTEDFETGALRPFWSVTGTGPFQTRVTRDNEPHAGQYLLTMDSWAGGNFARNELTLGVDLSGYTNVALRFWAREFGDDPHRPTINPFLDGADFDGVAISPDGVQWFEAQSLVILSNQWTELTVPLDPILAAHGLTYTSTFQIRFNQFDNNSIPLDGIGLDDISITGVAARRFTVLLPEEETEGSGRLAGQGRIQLGAPVPADLRVELVSSDPVKLAVPTTVVIPAGADSVAFDLTLGDNALVDGTQPVSVQASARNHVTGGAQVRINDNEIARLELKLDGKAREGDRAGKRRGKIKVKPTPQRDVAIAISSSDPTEVVVPPVVVFPAGQKEVKFELTIVDDFDLDGPQRVTITAHVPNWIDGRDTMQIRDDDKRRLGVELPVLASEGNGVLENAGLVRLAARQTNDLVVQLSSSNPDELVVPAQAIIPAGQFSARFDLDVQDDAEIDGVQSVKVTAAAKHYAKGAARIAILDDETPLAAFNPNPAHQAEGVGLDPLLAWSSGIGEALVNGDFETGDFAGWTQVNSGLGRWILNDGKLNPQGPDGPLPPFAGDYAALVEQIGSGAHVLFQDVIIPREAKSASLSWAQRIRNHADRFAAQQQEFRVEIRNTNDAVLEVIERTRPGDELRGDWTEHHLDLSGYRGQTIRLAFVEEDRLNFFNVHLDNVRLSLGEAGPTAYEVYFSRDSRPAGSAPVAVTSVPYWEPPALDLNTRYYWQVLTRRGAAQTWGPIWEFTTRGVGAVARLEWGPLGSPQLVHQPFPATLTARDDLGNVATGFSGPVTVQALPDHGLRSAVVVSEIDAGRTDRVEFMNVSGRWLDLTDWQIVLYDGLSWPNPRITFQMPTNAVAPPGGVFLLSRFGEAPGRYPNLFTGTNIVWNNTIISNQIAVLLRDAESNVVDFVCAVHANPARITNPISIPRAAWSGLPLPANTNQALTWQRVGQADHDDASDWVIDENTIGGVATNLLAPFTNSLPLRVQPDHLTDFVNGVWRGEMVLPQTQTAVSLLATDTAGHWALSTPLQVIGSNDLAVTLRDEPDLPNVGDDLAYVITLANSGPDAATGVWLTNSLPDAVAFVSVANASGVCSHHDGVVTCQWDTLAGGDSASVTIRVRPLAAGALTNRVRVSANELDGYPGDNAAEEVTTASYPRVTTTDRLTFEGNAGPTDAEFLVELSAASRLPVGVTFETRDGTATAGLDYTAVATNLFFPPGMTQQTVVVPILGDGINEAVELFHVALTEPTNAVSPVPSYFVAILDNDPQPIMSIGDSVRLEGPAGSVTSAVFQVTLSEPSAQTVTAKFDTQDGLAQQKHPIETPAITNLTGLGAATAAQDYVAQSGTVAFLPGTTNQTIAITIYGDRRFEPDEAFSVVLSAALNGMLRDNVGVGAILDDDAEEVDHFQIATVPSPRYAGVPFPLTVTARDGLGRVVSDFSGTTRLSGFPDIETVTIGDATQEWNYPLNAYFHDSRLQVIYPASAIGTNGAISALALQIELPPGQTLSNWTIRMKHTPLTGYAQPAWESNDWTTVFTTGLELENPGWHTFFLDTPFAYNGTDSLMVDFSFDNAFFTTDGLCLVSAAEGMRSAFFESDSAFGAPREWTDANAPLPQLTNLVPNIRLLVGAPTEVAPFAIGAFAQGIWTGNITVAGPVDTMRLRVVDALDRLGFSQPFSVEPGTDADGDGLPDAWELRFFGDLNHPAGGPADDPDHDGQPNLEEMRLGSDPRQAGGILRITSVEVIEANAGIRFLTELNQRYRVEWTDNLETGPWRSVADDLPGTGAEVEIRDPGGAGQPRRFYRILQLLPPF